MPVTKRVWDLALETLVAVALVSALVVWAFYVPVGTPFPARWVGLVASTAATFGYALRWCKRHWRLARFWLAFMVLLLLHSVIFVFVLLRVDEWRLMWFLFVGLPEFFVLCLILDAVAKGILDNLWGSSVRGSRKATTRSASK